jgi:hypothetical protein
VCSYNALSDTFAILNGSLLFRIDAEPVT